MKQGRIQIRIDKELEEAIKAYAKRHNLSVTQIMVKHFLDLLEKETHALLDAEQI